MDLGLAGKTVFVAGSSRGIGEAIAREFLSEGCNTIITGRDAGNLEKTEHRMQGGDKLLAIAGDLSDTKTATAALAQAVKRFGALDCMVINVGSGSSTPGWDVPEDAWASAFERNLWTSIRLAQEAMRAMQKTGGSILFTSSIAALTPTSAPLPSSAAKAALTSYASNLATLAAPMGIRVNCVAPGNILFPGGSWEKHLQAREAEVRDYIARAVPQERFGTPEEIAKVAVFLSSPAASFVTGACWVADGGQARKW